MPIVNSLLVSAAMMQDYFVDNLTGQAMSGGVITMYQDNSRTTLKNWYYQTGVPGNYTYQRLPNPLTLSAVGTITDSNGNDTIPFYYPWSETDSTIAQLYYVTVVNADGQAQFTRQAFPFGAGSAGGDSGGGGGSTNGLTLENYIINNRFWRNVGTFPATTLTNTISINGSSVFYAVLAPSQHDGFNMPDFQYLKNINGATETITFTAFPAGSATFKGDIAPEYYVNHNCTSAQAGETLKIYQFPISLHIATLNSIAATMTIQAQNISGTATLSLGIYQFLGTGATSPIPVIEKTFTLTPAWQKYSVSFEFPSNAGVTLGNGGDDAYYMQIGMPLAATFQTNFAIPSLYLSATVLQLPTNNFSTYDQIDAVINSPRTGDIRTSLNQFYYYGWVPMNDGTIGYNPTIADPYHPTAFNDQTTWPLFNLIWNLFSNYASGSTNLLAQLIDNTGANVGYGASAIADFNAKKSITLSHMMGKVLLGTVPFGALLQPTYYQAFIASANVLTTVSPVNFYNGLPIYLQNTGSLPSPLTANVIYYVSLFNGTNAFCLSTTFANAIAGTVITFGSGAGTVVYAPASAFDGEYGHVQLATELAQHVHNPLPPMTSFWGDGTTSNTISVGSGNPKSISLTTGGVTSFTATNPSNIVQPSTYMNMFMKL